MAPRPTDARNGHIRRLADSPRKSRGSGWRVDCVGGKTHDFPAAQGFYARLRFRLSTTPRSRDFRRRREQAIGVLTMAISDVKALTFDVFGTVVNWRDSIAREAKAFLGPKGYDKDWHDFADKWRARYQPAMTKVRTGELPWTGLGHLHPEKLIELLAGLGISGLGEAEIDHLNRT